MKQWIGSMLLVATFCSGCAMAPALMDRSGRLATFEQQGWRVSDYGANGIVQVRDPQSGATIHGRIEAGEWRPIFSTAAVVLNTPGTLE